MRPCDHEPFLRAIHEKRVIEVTFYSKEDQGVMTRRCLPWDYGRSSTAHNPVERYHVEDLESDTGRRHPIPLLPEQVLAIELTDDTFDPADFIDWPPTWWYPRDWGPIYSGTLKVA